MTTRTAPPTRAVTVEHLVALAAEVQTADRAADADAGRKLDPHTVWSKLHSIADPWAPQYAERLGALFDALHEELGGYRSSLSTSFRAAHSRDELPRVLLGTAERVNRKAPA